MVNGWRPSQLISVFDGLFQAAAGDGEWSSKMSKRISEVLDTIQEFLRSAGRRELFENQVAAIRRAAVARVAARHHIDPTTVSDKWRRQLGRPFAATDSIDRYLLAVHGVTRLRRALTNGRR